MEMLKSKPIIALIIMISALSYLSPIGISGVQSQSDSNEAINVQA